MTNYIGRVQGRVICPGKGATRSYSLTLPFTTLIWHDTCYGRGSCPWTGTTGSERGKLVKVLSYGSLNAIFLYVEGPHITSHEALSWLADVEQFVLFLGQWQDLVRLKKRSVRIPQRFFLEGGCSLFQPEQHFCLVERLQNGQVLSYL